MFSDRPRAKTSLGFCPATVSPLGRRNPRPRSLLARFPVGTRAIPPNYVPCAEECYSRTRTSERQSPGPKDHKPKVYNYSPHRILTPPSPNSLEARPQFISRFRRVSAEEFKTGVAQHIADYVRDGDSMRNYQPRDWDQLPPHKDWKTKQVAARNVKLTGDGAMWGPYNDKIAPDALRGIPDLTTPLPSRYVPRSYDDEDKLIKFHSAGAPMHKYRNLGIHRGLPFFVQTIREPMVDPSEEAKETQLIMKDFRQWSGAVASGGSKMSDKPEPRQNLTFAPLRPKVDYLNQFDGTRAMGFEIQKFNASTN